MSSSSKGKSVLKWIAGFFVVIFAVYFLFANTIIKAVLESKLGESYGAEVNIDSFDHSLFPTTVSLKGIALTNPTKPARNQVFVGDANADVELAPLLSDQVIVNNLNLLNVQFDTERASPGEVYRVPERSLSFDEMKAKAKDAVPSVDELLERHPLKTAAAVKNARAAYATYGEALKTDYASLPDKSRIDYYKTQIAQLKKPTLKIHRLLFKQSQLLIN